MASTSPKLENAPVPQAVRDVVAQLRAHGHAAYLVGGCVRDILRAQVPQDFDVATSARPEQVQAAFKRVIPTGVEHGTVTVVSGGAHVEVTTFRSEGDYVDGRRPSRVEFHADIAADLSRRDFTINAMALDPASGELVDPYGGQEDLARRCVRAVGDPLARFSEDGLRALRAVRFAAVLEFEIDPATEAAIPATLPVFQKIAVERVAVELQKLLLARAAPQGVRLLARTGLLGAVLPEALGVAPDAVAAVPADLDLRLAVLLSAAPDPRAAALRLKLPTKTVDRIAHLRRHREVPGAAVTDAELRRWLARVGPEHALDLLALDAALGGQGRVDPARVRQTLDAKPPLAARDLALDGKQIMAALGVGPSAAVGQAVRHLLEAVLEDPSRNTPEELGKLLQELKPRLSTGLST